MLAAEKARQRLSLECDKIYWLYTECVYEKRSDNRKKKFLNLKKAKRVLMKPCGFVFKVLNVL